MKHVLTWMLGLACLLSAGGAGAADDPAWSRGWRFDQRSGPALYAALCAGCHMPDGRGAQGAGRYPALAGNANVATTPYVLAMVLFGNRAMPGFASQLDDEQVAALARYVQQRFANLPEAQVRAEDVKPLRPVTLP